MSLFPLWDRAISVRSGFGCRDNILLSHSRPEAGAFFSAGLEASAFRLAEDGSHLSFLLTADNNHYFSASQVNDESLALAQVQFRKPFATEWQAQFPLEYFYQNQIVDVSATEVDLRTIEVEAHNVQFTPSLRRNVGTASWLELSAPVARRIYLDPLDSFWEGGPKLTFGRSYGRKSEWTIGYSFLERAYDSRTQTTSTSANVNGTTLEFRQHKFEIASAHFWDEARRWRSLTKFSYRLNADNGSGYFDYGRWQVSEQIRFRAKNWELLGEIRLGHYQFDTQTVSDTDSSKRHLSELIWHVRAERQFHKHLTRYADFEQEHAFSNQPIERYRVNTVSGGVIVEF